MKNIENKNSSKKSNEGLGQKIKDAWANKSTRILFIAFAVLIAFTVVKLVVKF